jgi:uncharacterized protein YciW
LHYQALTANTTGIYNGVLKLSKLINERDQAIDILANYCKELSCWNPLRSSYRKAQRGFVRFSANPRKAIAKTPALDGLSKTAHRLLDEAILGKLSIFPDRALVEQFSQKDEFSDLNPEPIRLLLQKYQAALAEIAILARTVREELRNYLERLEPLAVNASERKQSVIKLRAKADAREITVAKLAELAHCLAKRNPFNLARFRAKKQLEKFLKEAGQEARETNHTPQGDEQFLFILPAVQVAERSLGALLRDLDLAALGFQKIDETINRISVVVP